MGTRYSSVNFGSAYGGLSTVGYALYNFDATAKVARATASVAEVGTSTGVYSVSFAVDSGWDGMVLWDTGGASPVYAQDEKFSQINAIQDQTDNLRKIWNTLKNRFDYEGEVTRKLQTIVDKKQLSNEDIDKALQGLPYGSELSKVSDSIDAIKKAVSVAPKDYTSVLHGNKEDIKAGLQANISKIRIPDYSSKLKIVDKKLQAMNDNFVALNNNINSIEYPALPEINNFTGNFHQLQQNMGMSMIAWNKQTAAITNALDMFQKKIQDYTDKFYQQLFQMANVVSRQNAPKIPTWLLRGKK